MNGIFVPGSAAVRETLDWGSLAWVSRPQSTEATDLTVIEVTLNPGGGHNFHKHPDQEEVIYVLEGEVEQWLEQESRKLRPGDSIFIKAGIVHASFNNSSSAAKLLAILGPCVGEGGYVSVEVGDQEPWSGLR
ncbi:MAG: cupin domain-containing protein [Caldilineaceae bacterium]